MMDMDRIIKGREIYEKGYVDLYEEEGGKMRFNVYSTPQRPYYASYNGMNIYCTCPDSKKGHNDCKHKVAITLFLADIGASK